jgi:sugar O-acyltransferase (sialic acid O-acetyltransferase NeuD family)
MKPELLLIGGGGHCKSCIDVIEQEGKFQIAGIVDMPNRLHQKVLGYEIIATDDDIQRLSKEYENFLITVGQIKSPSTRIKLYKIVKRMNGRLPVIISPLAYVSQHTQIGEGTIILHHALLNAEVQVGHNCIINSRALIEHDAYIGNHCHIATGAVINGGVRVNSETFWGSCAVSIESIEIGNNVIIGCNASIKKHVPPNTIVN